jgi:hypothetical protein
VHPAQLPPEELLGQCQTTRTRRSGPGGQHRNKTETAIVLTHRPTQVQAEASERRSQAENLRMALQRLRVKLAIEIRTPPAELRGEPSDLWLSRLKGQRIVCSAEHADYPALVAEACDVLASVEFDMTQAAGKLGCTASQLVKLLATEPCVLVWLNRQRAERGLRPLK